MSVTSSSQYLRRKQLLPSLATYVDFGGGNRSAAVRRPSTAASAVHNLPTIQRFPPLHSTMHVSFYKIISIAIVGLKTLKYPFITQVLKNKNW